MSAPLLESTVFLCGCHGKLSGCLPLAAVGEFLERMRPGTRTAILDDLCQPGVLNRLLREQGSELVVLGACSQLQARLVGHDSGRRRTAVVDVLAEAESSYEPLQLSGRVKVLLLAQLKRQERKLACMERAQKLAFDRPRGEITRRELFGILLPRSQAVPYIEHARCAGGQRCSVCQGSCPFGAVSIQDGRVLIDDALCRLCGACVAVCPRNAVTYPGFTFEQLEQELAGLLSEADGLLEPRTIALVCRGGSVRRHKYPANVLAMELPCLALASARFLVRAFSLGAQGLVLIPGADNCECGLKLTNWRGTAEFVQELMISLGIGEQRMAVIEGGDAAAIDQRLAEFARGVAGLKATPTRFALPETEGSTLPELVAALGNSLATPKGRSITAGLVPFGKLQMDSPRCTGCGLCALRCPTSALTFSSASDRLSCHLVFHQASCVGCGQCTVVCPERCLRLENMLEIDRLSAPAEAIYSDKAAKCRDCGMPLAPRAMIERVRQKLEAAGAAAPYADFCPRCRIKAEFASMHSGIGV